MLEDFTDSELRSRCKRKLESLELWLRRLIDQILTNAFGDYFDHQDSAGNRLISSRITSPLDDRITREPQRYARKIDAVLLEDAIAIICNPSLYQHFRPALAGAFPEGHAEARTFLDRLLDPRNKLAHANPISIHEAERVLCYSDDIITSISAYYTDNHMNQDYNVPLFIRFTDSFGTTLHRDQLHPVYGGGIAKFFHREAGFDLRPGDTLTIEVEVDPAFDSNSYAIAWTSPNGLSNPVSSGPRAVIKITPKQVAQQFTIQCTLTTQNEWHRMGHGRDDLLMLTYRVLPPI